MTVPSIDLQKTGTFDLSSLENFKRLGEKSWFGPGFFLCCEDNVLSIKQLNLLQRFFRSLGGYKSTHAATLEAELSKCTAKITIPDNIPESKIIKKIKDIEARVFRQKFLQTRSDLFALLHKSKKTIVFFRYAGKENNTVSILKSNVILNIDAKKFMITSNGGVFDVKNRAFIPLTDEHKQVLSAALSHAKDQQQLQKTYEELIPKLRDKRLPALSFRWEEKNCVVSTILENKILLGIDGKGIIITAEGRVLDGKRFIAPTQEHVSVLSAALQAALQAHSRGVH